MTWKIIQRNIESKEGPLYTSCDFTTPHRRVVVEAKIKEVCYGTLAILLNATRKWPNEVSSPTLVIWNTINSREV